MKKYFYDITRIIFCAMLGISIGSFINTNMLFDRPTEYIVKNSVSLYPNEGVFKIYANHEERLTEKEREENFNEAISFVFSLIKGRTKNINYYYDESGNLWLILNSNKYNYLELINQDYSHPEKDSLYGV